MKIAAKEVHTMSEQENPKIRLVLHKGSMKVKSIILITVILATLSLGVLQRSIVRSYQQLTHYRNQAIVLEQENEKLAEDIANVNTAGGIAAIAQQELGLVSPDTVVFKPTSGN